MSKPPFQKRGSFKKEKEHRTNSEILTKQVRIVGEHPHTGEKLEAQVVSIYDALRMAKDLEVDLVEISKDSDPSICKLIEYSKFLYQQKRQKKENKKATSETKELRLSQNIDEHDIEFKTKHAEEWLKKGDKVKMVIMFKGRQIVYKEQGEMVMLKIATALEHCSKPEALPKMEGKKMFMMLTPRKK